MMATIDMIQQAQAALNAQPFSRMLKARVTAFSKDVAEIRLAVSSDLEQQYGFVHGGVISYLADNALTFAGGSALGTGVITSEYKINYVRPALGRELVARATVVHAGRTQAVCRCDVHAVDMNGRETLCAIAQGTIVLMTARTSARDDATDVPDAT